MRVPIEKLRRICDAESLRFETTESVNVKEGIIGQRKAFEALRVGAGVKDKDFNIYVAGASDTGKSRFVKRFLEKIASNAEDIFFDWCYVYNFQEPDRPKAISLPKGKAGEFKKDIDDLIALLQKKLPFFFETAEWKRKLAEKTRSLKELKTSLESEIKIKQAKYGFKMVFTIGGGGFLPVDPDNPNSIMPEEKYNSLTEGEKERIRENFKNFLEEYSLLVQELERLEVEIRLIEERLKKEELPRFISALTAKIKKKYRQNVDVVGYLDVLIEDVIENLDCFFIDKRFEEGEVAMIAGSAILQKDSEEFFRRYEVNIFVDNSQTGKIPVVIETNPTYSNLFGCIEAEMRQGVLTTNFLNIKAGAIHRANGGYLIIPAFNLLKQPIFCWEALKRTIKDQEIRIESPMNSYFGSELKSLKPQPVPFFGKIILIGEDWLYHLLYHYDDQFRSIFRVKVEMQERAERSPKMIFDVISVLAAFCAKNKLLPFDRTAAARLIEYLSELAENQKKLSLRLGEVENVLKEADFWAREAKKSVITGREISKTLRKKFERINRLEDRLLELHKEEILKIKVSGSEIGRINGLVVYNLGDYSFGMPGRWSARVGLGNAGIINVERECKLAGNIQAKSVFILKGYLLEKYGRERNVSFSASLCYEQSYSWTEGDSASVAELAVIISALAGIPIRQNLAITGSMNQHGEVQAIGGVNQKIKGFFKICCLKGITGDQGVIIPKDNIDELMLPKEIVKAVKIGKFHIFAVSTVEEALRYLTGLEPEEIDKKVVDRLEKIAEIIKGEKKEEKKIEKSN